MQTRLTKQRQASRSIDWKLTAILCFGSGAEVVLAGVGAANRVWWATALIVVATAAAVGLRATSLRRTVRETGLVCAAIGAFAIVRRLGVPGGAAVAAAAAMYLWPTLVGAAMGISFRFR